FALFDFDGSSAGADGWPFRSLVTVLFGSTRKNRIFEPSAGPGPWFATVNCRLMVPPSGTTMGAKSVRTTDFVTRSDRSLTVTVPIDVRQLLFSFFSARTFPESAQA